MKKIFTILILSFSFYLNADAIANQEVLTKPTVDQFIDNLIFQINNIPSSPLNIPFWGQMRAFGITAFCTGMSNLLSFGLANIFFAQKNQNGHKSVLYAAAALGTTLGLGTGAYCAYQSEHVHGIEKQLSDARCFIETALCYTDDADQLRSFMLQLLPLEQFPRMTAFKVFEIIHNQLNRIEEIALKAERRNKKYNARTLQQNIQYLIGHVENAMIIIKNDPLWMQECNAYSMRQTQQAMNTNNNIQLGATLVDVANAYSRNK